MNYQFPIKKSALALAVSLTAFVTSSNSVYAQEGRELEEIVITGSRIPQNANLESASPVTQVGADEFLYTGITRVEDLMNDLPQVTGSNVANDSNGATGTASVDLRDLGTKRTLTLMNGRRLPVGSPQGGGDGADLNFIPSALVQRVEVLTGGGSATYGSDAVAGVVNFIIDDNFEGLRFDLQASAYQHKNDNAVMQGIVSDSGFELPDSNVIDGNSYSFSVTGGKNFADGAGNITGYLNYRKTDEVRQDQRDYSACALQGYSVDGSFRCGGSSTLPQGRITDFGDLKPNSFDYIVQGDQFVKRNGELYNYAPDNFFQRPDERTGAGIFAHYNFTDNLTGYAEFGYMKNETKAQIAPSGNFFVTDSLYCGNPLLSEQQFQAICGSFGLTRNDTQRGIYIGRRNVEGGPRNDNPEHVQSRVVLGLKGDINDNWSFDSSLNYAQVDFKQQYDNDLSATRIARALDVVRDPSTGNPVCRSVVNGTDPNCVPWNLFQTGGVTQDQIDYLVLDLYAEGDTKMTNFVSFVTGDLTDYGVQLPSASSGVQVVAGIEYRKDELSYRPNAGFASGDGAGQGGPVSGVDGSVSVNELFAEASVPVTDSLDLGLGYRYSDYSTDENTDTYKLTFDWRVTESVKARASYQAATRHASVRELFRPQVIGLFNNGNDPCSGASPDATFEQCARSGVTADQYGSIAPSPAGQYNQLAGGISTLIPEESDTISFGFVFTPEALPGLDITVDWFNITVDDAINPPGAQFILNSCVFKGLECDRVNRGKSGTLWIGSDNIVNLDDNLAYQEREGIDLAVNYGFDIGDAGSISLGYTAAYVTKNDREPIPGAEIVDCNGKWGGRCSSPNPQYRHNMRLNWESNGSVTTSLAWRYHGKVDDDAQTSKVENFDAQSYFDLSLLWALNDQSTVRLGINNLFDKEPPIAKGGANGNVEVTEYDVLGRYLFLGFSYDM